MQEFDLKLSIQEVALMSQMFSGEKNMVSMNFVEAAASLKTKIKPIIETIVAEQKLKEEVTPAA